MAWLLRSGDVLASVHRPTSAVARLRATAALESGDGVLWCAPSHVAHSFGARGELDVAYVDSTGVVLALCRLGRARIGRPRLAANAVLEGRAGAFAHWDLRPGDRLEIRE
jgi:uncharacterized membrane protein (UPF0127 family)